MASSTSVYDNLGRRWDKEIIRNEMEWSPVDKLRLDEEKQRYVLPSSKFHIFSLQYAEPIQSSDYEEYTLSQFHFKGNGKVQEGVFLWLKIAKLR